MKLTTKSIDKLTQQPIKHKIILATMIIFSFITCSCKKENTTSIEEGYATGKITDTQGKPLAGVEVAVENTLMGYHSSANGVTDHNGLYKIKISKVGSFHTSAYLNKNFEGKSYKLALHCDSNEPFGNEGGIRNFQWKLSGQKPNIMEGFYGATIEIHNEPGYYIDQEEIIFTLTPIGKLIDGTTGSALAMCSGQPQTATYGYLVDIPLGKYKVTASYKGTSLKLKKLDSDQAYATTAIIEFEQIISSGSPTARLSYHQ